MGAWGPGIFDNDSAADWMWEYEDGGVTPVKSILAEVADTPEDDYVDVDMGSWALAAGEVVATSHGQPPKADPEMLATLRKHGDAVLSADGLPPLAIKALERVMAGNSELSELWAETGGDAEAAFQSAVMDLKTRLEAIR